MGQQQATQLANQQRQRLLPAPQQYHQPAVEDIQGFIKMTLVCAVHCQAAQLGILDVLNLSKGTFNMIQAPGKNTWTKRQLQFSKVTAENFSWTQQGYWWGRKLAQGTCRVAGTFNGFIKWCQGGSKEPSHLYHISLTLMCTFEKVPGMIGFWTPWFRCL